MKEFALAELQAVLRTAARGVGVAASCGEELAEAVAYAADDFAEWEQLRSVFAEPVVSGGDAAVRCLLDAPNVVDDLLVRDGPMQVAEIDAPAILALYLARASHLFGCTLNLKAAPEGWVLSREDAVSVASPSTGRVFLPDTLYVDLSEIAARTHVPATEETRLSGAGAGLNDND